MRAFGLAPMSSLFRAMTLILAAIPVVLVAAAMRAPLQSIKLVLLCASLFVGAIYLSVWLLLRPSRFEVDAHRLRILWPLRSQDIALASIEAVDEVSMQDVQREFGRGMRYGAGGLFGSFGQLITPKARIGMYISRSDALVLLRRRLDPPMLISPERPADLVAEIRRALGR
jgi:hypothetical protein